ncbi:MAG: right-handed parallel beta-helix repeat-containing protein [Phycisphaerales bacterium]
MHTRHTLLAASFGLALAALAIMPAAAPALVGPINPPAGPVTSTAKPLTEVEPRIAINATNTPGDADSVYRITQPGSYYLTGNIAGVAGKSGIEIAVGRVTIDLKGFHMQGVAGSLAGITSGQSDIRISNGLVTNWGVEGINLTSGSVSPNTVENVNVAANAGSGIRIPGGTVRNCILSGNGVHGIFGATVVQGCTAHNNTGIGIQANSGAVVQGCLARDNDDDGIEASNGSTVTDCTARNNGGYGIIAFGSSVVSRCSSTFNTVGGINGQQATTILDCNASDNDGYGIIVQGQCYVRGNTCHGNGGAGIYVSSVTGTQVEGNNMTNNARGLQVTGTNCVVIRNTASGNTVWNWDIDANNVVGPILDRTAVVSGSINGNSAPSSLGSTDTNANFTY